jgi:hypothetical protein
MIGTPAANAAIINIEVGEGGPPSAPPPPGGLLSLCLQIRPNPASCIAL